MLLTMMLTVIVNGTAVVDFDDGLILVIIGWS